MNFLVFYVLATNFIVFWGFWGFMAYNTSKHGVAIYPFLLLLIFISGLVVSALPFIIPTLVTAFLGMMIWGHGKGYWPMELIGSTLFVSSVFFLFVFATVNLDSLKARYWRKMYLHRSPLEKRLGAETPYIEMEVDENWALFFYPILAPILHLYARFKEGY